MSDSATQDPFTPEFESALDAAVETPLATAPSPAPAAQGATAAPEVEVDPNSTPLERAIVDAIKTVYDPEIPVNVYEIGLIYNIDVQPDGKVAVKMTLTSPACPSAQELPAEVKDRVEGVAGVASCDVEIVWDPTWNPSMMSEAARLQLGFF